MIIPIPPLLAILAILAKRAARVAPPTAALAAPGECQFSEAWTSARLVSRRRHSRSDAGDSWLLTFALPDAARPLGLSTCACVLARARCAPADEADARAGPAADRDEGELVVRPYTPVSTNRLRGRFVLLVRAYPRGRLSKRLGELRIGESVEFSHGPKNVKIQAPFGRPRALAMLAGGTGVAPMVQALHAVLGEATGGAGGARGAAPPCEVTVLYGSRHRGDILLRRQLDAWARAFDRLTLVHVLSDEPARSRWRGARGMIDRDLIAAHCAPPIDARTGAPAADVKVFVCGPPPMYAALCGPRDDPEVSGVLAEMGYTSEQVVKF